MKSSLAVLLLIVFSAVANAQSRVLADHVRGSDKIVKGAPFTAKATSESVQTFSDGNRITRRSETRIYRDREGRVRREDMPKQIGISGTVVDVPESIVIIDPVQGVKYVLNSKKNTARLINIKPAVERSLRIQAQKEAAAERKRKHAAERAERMALLRAEDGKRKVNVVRPFENGPAGSRERVNPSIDKEVDSQGRTIRETRTESIGVRNMEGVDVEGTRITTSVPAGAIGNEKEIVVVYEKWYSKDLQLIVFATHSDPAFGEQTYRMTNITLNDPPISLFSPPADYTIVGEKGPRRSILKKPLPPPKSPETAQKEPPAPLPPSVPRKQN